MSKKSKLEFNGIVEDILYNSEFLMLDNELHHGITRYSHSLRVAKTTYKLCKLFKMKNREATTRAALLHDFYIDSQFGNETSKQKLLLHPKLACQNAKRVFNINKMQENIIESHMFPLKGEVPKYKESWLVSGVDKAVALYEMYRFKIGLLANVWLLFIFNLIIIQK